MISELGTGAEAKASQPNFTTRGVACVEILSTSRRQEAQPNMIFSDFYKSPRSPLSKLRHNQKSNNKDLPAAGLGWQTDDYANLVSKDKVKQKEAIKAYLARQIRNDWDFEWPKKTNDCTNNEAIVKSSSRLHLWQELATTDLSTPMEITGNNAQVDQGYQLDSTNEDPDDDINDNASDYSVVSEDTKHFRSRLEWISDLSDEEPTESSPYRFNSPESVEHDVCEAIEAKRARRRRQLREETSWNPGLACFEARRNAWTGARTVRVKVASSTPLTDHFPKSSRGMFKRPSISSSPPTPPFSNGHDKTDNIGAQSDTSSLVRTSYNDSRRSSSKDTSPSTPPNEELYRVQTLLPLPPPILPPKNSLRTSITPNVYLNLYDKVIMHGLQPACPINLSDMLRSCVSGWQRDGEWPPRPANIDPAFAAMQESRARGFVGAGRGGKPNRRLPLVKLVRDKGGREKDENGSTGKGIRRSLQRALGIGPVPGPNDSPQQAREMLRQA